MELLSKVQSMHPIVDDTDVREGDTNAAIVLIAKRTMTTNHLVTHKTISKKKRRNVQNVLIKNL